MYSNDYSALFLRTTNGCVLELVPQFGGLTNRLILTTPKGPTDVIVGLTDRNAMETDKVYRGIPIFPLVNRLDKGRYEFEGVTYQLPLNEPSRDNALHGLLHHLKPTVDVVEDEHSSSAILTYAYRGQEPGYPFHVDVVITYTVKDSSELDIQFKVINRHSSAIPIGIGWHPYFGFSGSVDELSLQLPSVSQLEVDDRLLPTGKKESFTDFAKLRPISTTQFDTCYAISDASKKSIAKTLLWSEKQQFGLEIWQETGEKGLNYIQVCTAQDRQSIAIEPVSCGINAFINGDGLIILPMDDSITARMGVRLITAI